MNELSNSASSALRSKRFRYAVATSLSSKITTAALQIIALPIAAISLGVHGFALYSMLTAAVGWLALSNLGIGPTLIVKLATAHVYGKIEEERSIFSSAFFSVLTISSAVFLIVIFSVWTLPVQNIFGPLYVSDVQTIKWGLTTLASMFLIQSLLSLFESAQAGYQEQYIQNLFATVSSIPCILAILAIARLSPTPVSMILALNVPIVLFRIGNTVYVLLRHSHVFPSFKSFRWSLCKELLRSGSIYSLAGGVGNFFAHVLPVILIGRTFNAEISSAFAATMNAIILISGVLSMVSAPLWPAIADSVARGDGGWARKAYRRLLWAVMSFGLITFLFLCLRGEWLFHVWFKGEINPSRSLILAAGLYFVTLCWEVAHFTILVGLKRIEIASVLVCVRAVLGVIATIACLRMGHEAIPFIVMFISIVCVDFIPLRRFVLRSLLV
jgi:O-antigen/teichoic acid export membrane protein